MMRSEDEKLPQYASGRSDEEVGKAAVRKSFLILMPTILVTASLAYIDRSNVAYAATTIKKQLNITNSQYGLGSGLLYVSYCFFQVPSQLVVRKIGAPIWLSVIVVAWGIVAAATAAMKNAGQFYMFRFLLGMCEAGTFPALYYHLSLFFSDQELSFAYAILLSALSISQIIGGPLAGGLQYLAEKGGLHGYQWLFIIEGALTVLWGLVIWRILPRGPEASRILNEEERTWLLRRRALGLNYAARKHPTKSGLLYMLSQWRLWYYAIIGFLVQAVLAGCIFFVPLIIDSMFTGKFNGQTPTTKIKTQEQLNWQICKVGLIAAILYTCTATVGICVGYSSRRFRERNLHIFSGLTVAAICLMCVPITLDHKGAISAFALLTVGACGVFGVLGPICSWVVTLLHGFAREVAFGLFNAIGGIGAFSGPTIIGRLSNNGKWRSSLYFLGAFCIASALMALAFRPVNILEPTEKEGEEGSVDKSLDLHPQNTAPETGV